MGYDTTLKIGTTSSTVNKDKTIYFMEYASIDLCKAGSCNLSRIDWENNSDFKYYWYDGNEKAITKDCYGDSSRAVPISEVVEALEKDVKESEYRRFKWALALLKSMQDDTEQISVLFYGH